MKQLTKVFPFGITHTQENCFKANIVTENLDGKFCFFIFPSVTHIPRKISSWEKLLSRFKLLICFNVVPYTLRIGTKKNRLHSYYLILKKILMLRKAFKIGWFCLGYFAGQTLFLLHEEAKRVVTHLIYSIYSNHSIEEKVQKVWIFDHPSLVVHYCPNS